MKSVRVGHCLMVSLWMLRYHTTHSSKRYFCPGGMAPSELTHSVRAVTDTPVVDYSAPGLNTTGCVAYRPLIAVSPFLLALSVSCFKHTLWLLWATVTLYRNGFIGYVLASGLECDG